MDFPYLPGMKKTGISLGLALLVALSPAAETVLVEAQRDATLIEDPRGARANGAGPVFFAGRTSQATNGIRRALLYFDIAAVLPDNAIIEGVSLHLFHVGGNNAPREIDVHRVLAAWEEGPAASSGGGGAPSQSGDVTWRHRSYDRETWVRAGGQFVGRISARQVVGPTGSYTWDGAHLLQDVRLWNHVPQRNFGWILIGDETTFQNAKKLASRENPDASRRPRLEIRYRLPGRP